MLDHTPSAQPRYDNPNLRGKRILVVEDDAVIAADYYFQLRQAGVSLQAFEPTNRGALDYLVAHDIDGAIVDYRLRDGTCEPVLKVLERRAIPVVVVSGCTFEMCGTQIPHPVLPKPVAPTDLWRALSEILR